MILEKQKLDKFEYFRVKSIDLLSESKIDKEEFLERNYSFIKELGLKPFSKIIDLEEAVYNYQYYNIMAKYANQKAFKLQNLPKKKKAYLRLINDRENYYCLKDIATKSLLEIVGYDKVEAYFINLRSKRLTGRIFEISINSYDRLILHSKNEKILKRLKENDAFKKEVRKSLIDSYVNRSY